ncbi:MAG: DUF5711 family protein [Oscillospiraceae bacterium]
MDNFQDEEELHIEEKRGGGARRFLIFLLTLVTVFGVIMIAAYRDGTGFDVLRRVMSYWGNKGESAVEYLYDADRTNRFVPLGDSFAVVSGTSIKLFSEKGKLLCDKTVKLANPAVRTGGSALVAYDVGGTMLYVVQENGELWELQTEAEEPYLAATLNDSDYLAVTTEKKSYKGAVSVYDPTGELLFAFHSSDRFVTDACVADSNHTLAVVTLGQRDNTFLTNIVLYPLDSTEPSGSYAISDGLVLQIDSRGRLTTVADTCLTFADETGKVLGSYPYRGQHLREYELAGDGFAALLLNRYQSGSVGQLVTVDTAGAELARLEVTEEILNLSAAGRYLAVLYADRLVIYTSDLQPYATLPDTTYAKDVLMRRDGSALVLGASSAKLYLP